MIHDVSECPGHLWASDGVAVVDGEVTRIWSCERCVAWTGQPLGSEARVDWDETALSG